MFLLGSIPYFGCVVVLPRILFRLSEEEELKLIMSRQYLLVY